MRQYIPSSVTLAPSASSSSTNSTSSTTTNGPAFQLTNPSSHTFSIHPVKQGVVRVVHSFPFAGDTVTGGLRPVTWEETERGHAAGLRVEKLESLPGYLLTISPSGPVILVDLQPSKSPRLSWFSSLKDYAQGGTSKAFLRDSETRAYAFDKGTGGVWHYTERENHLPVSEFETHSTNNVTGTFLHEDRNEFIYGLGESRGSLEKSKKKFTLEGRDGLGYDWENGDPLYKVHPYFCVYNKKSKKWYGIFYNSLVDATIDTGSESDILWGCFRSYKSNRGPLDYYVLTGDGTLPSILSLYSSLVSPSHNASPTLPPLSQFGYLSSSLSLAAEPKAQEEIIAFLKRSREEGFPVDGLYLSSGWCQEEKTDDRLYFHWNEKRYPNPIEFGNTVEKELDVQVIVNVKPWLLEVHPMLGSAEAVGAFVKAPKDIVLSRDPDQVSEKGSAKSWVWSSGFGCHKLGRYFDYSSKGGSRWWKDAIGEHLLKKGLTGVWIDNNEMAGMVDDDCTLAGELGMWNAQGVETSVEKRMGWGGRKTTVGAVGKAIQTMGMARATYEALITARPHDRPVIVSRSGVPGIQAYAHASWSGDNSTTWDALKYGTKMTLSVGMSFGPGLYGHDIGGFAGKHHPSSELLIRWCQNGAWHSRFTVHSWKEISTTLWMYEREIGVTDILREVLAFRYRLAPSFYSLYITEYHRNGWPILKPMLWHHSEDPKTLKLDEEFIFGSHIHIASVVEQGARTRSVYLPSVAVGGEEGVQWCELDTGKWHAGEGKRVELAAPLERTPVLVRGGGMLVLGGECKRNIYDGINERTVLIFPSPASSTKPRAGTFGTFNLIEDDFKSNEHTFEDVFTEIQLSFRTITNATGTEVVEIDYKFIHRRHQLPYELIGWELPKGDTRQMVAARGKELVQSSKNGKTTVALRIV